MFPAGKIPAPFPARVQVLHIICKAIDYRLRGAREIVWEAPHAFVNQRYSRTVSFFASGSMVITWNDSLVGSPTGGAWVNRTTAEADAHYQGLLPLSLQMFDQVGKLGGKHLLAKAVTGIVYIIDGAMTAQQFALEFHGLGGIRYETSQHDSRYGAGTFFPEYRTTRAMSIMILLKNGKFPATNRGGQSA